MSVFGTPAIGQGQWTSGSSMAATAVNTAASDLLVVGIRWAAPTLTVSSITDTAGNTFLPLTARTPGGSASKSQLYYCIGAKANSSNIVTANFSGTLLSGWIVVWDIPITGTGLIIFDVEAGNQNNGSVTSLVTGAFTTMGFDELALVAAAPDHVAEVVNFTGYTSDSTSIGGSGFGGAGHKSYATVQSAITVTGTWGTSTKATIVLAAFSSGLVVSDTITFTDFPGVGYGLLIADTVTFSDTMALSRLEFDFVIVDILTFSDSIVTALNEIDETLADTLTFSDDLDAGYGNANVDSITFIDSTGVGYGDLISDALVLSDSVVVAVQLSISVTETLTISDATGVGYGLAATNSITLSESLLVGYGYLLSDSANFWLETFVTSSGGAIGISFADSLTFSESLVAGYGNQTVDQLLFIDGPGVGYGDLIADSIALVDSLTVQFIAAGLSETPTDTLTLSDGVAAGYGDLTFDSLTLTDSIQLGVGGITLSDSISMTEALNLLMTHGLSLSEQIAFNDALTLLYGLSISDFVTLSEQLGQQLAGVLFLAAVDSGAANWQDVVAERLDTVLSGEVKFAALRILSEVQVGSVLVIG